MRRVARTRKEGERLLGPLEAEVMERLWEAGEPLSVRQLLERLNRGRRQQLAYTTVMTVMVRLAEKGALVRRRDGRGFVYEATADDLAGLAVRGVLRDFGEAAVAHFVEEAKADPEVLERLRRLLGEEP
jgi:predicted transcriptional regulator